MRAWLRLQRYDDVEVATGRGSCGRWPGDYPMLDPKRLHPIFLSSLHIHHCACGLLQRNKCPNLQLWPIEITGLHLRQLPPHGLHVSTYEQFRAAVWGQMSKSSWPCNNHLSLVVEYTMSTTQQSNGRFRHVSLWTAQTAIESIRHLRSPTRRYLVM